MCSGIWQSVCATLSAKNACTSVLSDSRVQVLSGEGPLALDPGRQPSKFTPRAQPSAMADNTRLRKEANFSSEGQGSSSGQHFMDMHEEADAARHQTNVVFKQTRKKATSAVKD